MIQKRAEQPNRKDAKAAKGLTAQRWTLRSMGYWLVAIGDLLRH